MPETSSFLLPLSGFLPLVGFYRVALRQKAQVVIIVSVARGTRTETEVSHRGPKRRTAEDCRVRKRKASGFLCQSSAVISSVLRAKSVLFLFRHPELVEGSVPGLPAVPP